MVALVHFRAFGRGLGAKAARIHLVDAVCLLPENGPQEDFIAIHTADDGV